MRFSAIHKISSYLMVLASLSALALSREIPLWIMGLTTAGALASYPFEPTRYAWMRHRMWSTVWNGVTILSFLWAVTEVFRGDALGAGIRFLCLLLVNKLWNRRSSRDYLQAYVITFLMVIAGAALSSEFTYAISFLGYIIFSTWTLTLFHLRREMEENYLLKHSDGTQSERVEVERILNSRRIVGRSFLLGTSLVSVGIFLLSAAVFFLIPRFGFGFFANRQRRGMNTVGFSERVSLGEYGLVKDNPQVVMRVEFPSGLPPLPVRMRAVSFDRYVNGRWSRTQQITPEPMRRWGDLSLPTGDLGGLHVNTPLNSARIGQLMSGAIVQNIYIDPMDTPVLFGMPKPIAFQMTKKFQLPSNRIEFEGRGAGETIAIERKTDASGRTYSVERKSGLHYTVYSVDRMPSAQTLVSGRKIYSPEETSDLAPYLAVPPNLPKRIADLAQSIARGHESVWGKAHAIESYLQKQYGYTLDLKRDPRFEPLDDFLFVQKAGHCEYFASAMAVMLRTVGVASRSVNGFFGGEWNQYGKYVAIRQGDAHSWVEVWLPDVGWFTFDPTPPGQGMAPRSGLVVALRQLFDTLELTWFKYVIEYDLEKQADALVSVKKWSQKKLTWSAPDWRKSKPFILGGLALAVAIVGLVRLRRRHGPRSTLRQQRTISRSHFEQALAALARRGLERRSVETAAEFSDRVVELQDPAAADFRQLVLLYNQSRWGEVEVPADAMRTLAARVVKPPAEPRPSA